MRISVEGRYYGRTNPGAYFNNNIMALLSLLQVRPAGDGSATATIGPIGRAAIGGSKGPRDCA